jgi:DUF1707 SHOCT-like domain/Cell wall-active antibiotics response LiaF, C-terminal
VSDNRGVNEPHAPELRASDADRERLAAVLRENLGEGRLTLDEFSERVDAAYTARTVADLAALTRDLPAAGEAVATPERRRPRPTRWSVAVMSGVARKNRWRIEERTRVVAVMGGAHLDLRSAEIEGAEAEIVAVSVMGGIDIIVPDGVEVEVTGIALMGGKNVSIKDDPPLPGAPFVRVHVFALMGGVNVRSRPPRHAHRAGAAALDAGP